MGINHDVLDLTSDSILFDDTNRRLPIFLYEGRNIVGFKTNALKDMTYPLNTFSVQVEFVQLLICRVCGIIRFF